MRRPGQSHKEKTAASQDQYLRVIAHRNTKLIGRSLSSEFAVTVETAVYCPEIMG